MCKNVLPLTLVVIFIMTTALCVYVIKHENELKEKLMLIESYQGRFFSEMESDMFEITAYDPSPISTGKWAKYKKTKTGTTPNSLRTVAVDPKVIPLGSLLYIEGIGWRVAEDTGRLIKGKIIDIYFDKYREAKQFGRKRIKVYYFKKDYNRLLARVNS